MTSNTSRCSIWPEFEAEELRTPTIHGQHLKSNRTGGAYCISVEAGAMINALSDSRKARLTTWLVNQRLQGVTEPVVTKEVLSYVDSSSPLSVHERADRLLRFTAMQASNVGDRVSILQDVDGAFAWSESTGWHEVDYFLDYLQAMGWLNGERFGNGGFIGTVTVDGYAHLVDSATNTTSTQAFVAMWFDRSMDDAYYQGIVPAIQRAGYNDLRIDKKSDVVKIDDEIIAEIRRSRFLVADFTQHEREARGGVYFEAGYAKGLGIPVIFTCRKDVVDANNLHFDTRQYAHIVWETPEELRDNLLNRIRARIGQGPLAPDQGL